MDELINDIQQDVLVHVYIGKNRDAIPFRFAKSLLCSLSSRLHDKIKASRFDPDRNYIPIGLALDDFDAWEVLAYWIVKKEIPDEAYTTESEQTGLLARCWVLGAKYEIDRFQRKVMKVMIAGLDPEDARQTTVPSLRSVKIAFAETERGSPLQKVMVRRIAQFGYTSWPNYLRLVFNVEGFDGEMEEFATRVAELEGSTVDAAAIMQYFRDVARRDLEKGRDEVAEVIRGETETEAETEDETENETEPTTETETETEAETEAETGRGLDDDEVPVPSVGRYPVEG